MKDDEKSEKKVLIIDDNPDICEVVSIILSRAGYKAKAIERFEPLTENELPDLILLDMKMSDQDGRQICRHLKSVDTTRDVPVIMFSASPDIEKEATRAGADDFIAKPFEIKELLGKIQRLDKAA